MLVAARPGLIQPTQMAKMIATFDQMSGGRLRVNLIAGGGVEEMAADGVFLDHDDRYALMEEMVAVMKRCWTERAPFDHDGRFVRLRGADVRPKPLQRPHPPLYIGGISPAALAVGTRHADVYLLWANTEDQITADIATVRAAAAAAGREHSLRLGIRAHVCVRESATAARRAAEALVAGASDRQRAARFASMGNQSHADARMRELAFSTAAADHWLAPTLFAGVATVRHGAGVVITGSPEEVAATLQGYIDLGITSFCLSGWPHDDEATRFGDLVLPAFR
jgi:alkanesulfonate monooxygenase